MAHGLPIYSTENLKTGVFMKNQIVQKLFKQIIQQVVKNSRLAIPTFAMTLLAFGSHSQAQGQGRHNQNRCDDRVYEIQQKLSTASRAVEKSTPESESLSSLSLAVSDLATSISTSVDVRGELQPTSASIDNQIRNANSVAQESQRELRRTYPDIENLGSRVWQIARESAQRFDASSNALRSASSEVDRMRGQIANLQRSINTTRDSKNLVSRNLSLLDTLTYDLRDLASIQNIDDTVASYVASCSYINDDYCYRLRSELRSTSQSCSSSESSLTREASSLGQSRHSLDLILSRLGGDRSTDIESSLNSVLRDLQSNLESAGRQLSAAANQCRVAANESSGTGFDQQVSQAINLGEAALRALNATTVSGLQAAIDRAADQVGQPDTNSSRELRQVANQLDSSRSYVSSELRKLGTRSSRGDLDRLDIALDSHKRCH